jgi:hypothetical protein
MVRLMQSVKDNHRSDDLLSKERIFQLSHNVKAMLHITRKLICKARIILKHAARFEKRIGNDLGYTFTQSAPDQVHPIVLSLICCIEYVNPGHDFLQINREAPLQCKLEIVCSYLVLCNLSKSHRAIRLCG